MFRRISLPAAERLVFYGLLALQLLPLWSVRYYLTIDGPCHLYNAKVLADMAANAELKAFYENWLFANQRFEPNWFSHFFMKTLFAAGVPAFLNEKLLQTFYVLAFGLGLRFVLRQIHPKGLFLSSLGLLFTYHHVFQMGFYNYSCSLALCLWAFGYWLKYRADWSVGRQLGLAALWLVLYFCHPIGFLFSFLLIGSDVLAQQIRRGPPDWASVGRQLLGLGLSALPVLVLFAEYVAGKGMSFRPSGESAAQIWRELVRLSALCTVMNEERDWAPLIAAVFPLLAGLALWLKIRQRAWRRTDMLLGVFLATLLIYVKQPGSFAGGGILSVRLQILPYLMLLLWLASVDFPKWVQGAVLAFSVGMSVLLWSIRLPAHWRASEAVQEYASCAAALPDRVSVLPLSFNHNGQLADGREVSSATWLFVHAAGYAGAERSIVLLDNYEAHTGNFPLLWKPSLDPFLFLPKEDTGFEGQPPRADFLHFPEKTKGAQVDYVLCWCLDKKFGEHPFTQEIKQQLDQGYELVFSSTHDLARVYKKK